MQWLAEISVKRPVFASVLVLSLAVVGVFAYFRRGVDLFPKVDFPMITVTTRQSGAAPEEIETEITDKVERAVNTISGIDELRSVSTEGVSQVFVMFKLEKNVDVAAQEVRDKVNQILPDLPQDIDQPVVDKMDPDAAPVIYVALSADRPIRDISEFADKTLRREIESISGVGQVTLVGSRLRQVNLWLDPARLRAYSLTAAEVTRAVTNQNLMLPGGNLAQGARELTVRMKGRVNSVPEFDGIVVASRAGAQITLAQVGRAEDGIEEPETAGNVDGKSAVILAVRRQSGTNTVAVADEVTKRLNAMRSRLPAGYKMEITRDQSDFIKASVKNVQEHLIVGAILAALVVLLFLRNWPYVYNLAKTDGSSVVKDKFAVAPLPGVTGPGASSLGGRDGTRRPDGERRQSENTEYERQPAQPGTGDGSRGAATQRLDRRDATGSPGRLQRCRQRDHHSDDHRQEHGAQGDLRPVQRDRTGGADPQERQHGQADAGGHPHDRAHRPENECLQQDEAHDLGAAGPGGAQQADLVHALGHRHRESVEDEEGAGKEDHGRNQQQRSAEVGRLRPERIGRVGGLLEQVGLGRDHDLELADQLVHRDPRASAQVYARHAGRGEEHLGRGQRNDDQSAGRIGQRAVARDDADDRERLRPRAGAAQGDRVPESQALLARHRLRDQGILRVGGDQQPPAGERHVVQQRLRHGIDPQHGDRRWQRRRRSLVRAGG